MTSQSLLPGLWCRVQTAVSFHNVTQREGSGISLHSCTCTTFPNSRVLVLRHPFFRKRGREWGLVPNLQAREGVCLVPKLQTKEGVCLVPKLQAKQGVCLVPKLQAKQGVFLVPKLQEREGECLVPKLEAWEGVRLVPKPQAREGVRLVLKFQSSVYDIPPLDSP